MILEFSLTNFGPVKDQVTLSFEATRSDLLEDYYIDTSIPGLRLLKLGIIYGPNASGKTTILKALSFLRNLVRNPVSDKSESLKLHPFALDEESKSQNSKFSLHFIEGETRYAYHLECNQQYIFKESLLYYPRGRSASIYTRETDPDKELTKLSFGSTVKLTQKDQHILEGNTLWNTTVLGAFGRSNVDSPELRVAHSWFRERVGALVLPSNNLMNWSNEQLEKYPAFRSLVVESLRNADVQIQDFRVEEQEVKHSNAVMKILETIKSMDDSVRIDDALKTKTVHFTHEVLINGAKYQEELPQQQESRGTLKFYGLSVLLATALKLNRVLIIDEIETSLHPDLMKHFLLVFLANSKKAQLIATTHNTFLLDEKDLLRADAVWFAEKGGDGATKLYSLSDFDSATFRKGQSLINAYKVGKLGAKPQTGSIFLQSNKPDHAEEE